MRSILITLLILTFSLPLFGGIYGLDDRKDFFDIQDPKIQEIARSTAHIVDKKQLQFSPDGTIKYKKLPLGIALNFCTQELFIGQISIGHCSASLVGEDTLLTAGHCFSPYPYKKGSFKDMYVIFDFLLEDPSQTEVTIKKSNLFRMEELLYYAFSPMEMNNKDRWKDLALIKLDRKVNRPPLKVNKSLDYIPGTKLYMLGHPLGLPLKFADNGEILRVEKDRHSFRHDLDAFSSNSGASIFNAETDEIIGVMVRGESSNFDTATTGCYEWGKAKVGQSEEATFLSELPIIP